MNQKLFETIERITGHSCLESELDEIKNSVEFKWFDPNVTLPQNKENVLFVDHRSNYHIGYYNTNNQPNIFTDNYGNCRYCKKWCFLPE